jgi:hypothetical protein
LLRSYFGTTPSLSRGVVWVPGWIFATPESGFIGSHYSADIRANAKHLAIGDDDAPVHALLLNPIDGAGKLAYRLSDPGLIKRLCRLAQHEAAHIVVDRHDETFSVAREQIIENFDENAAFAAIHRAIVATRRPRPARRSVLRQVAVA